MAAYQSSKVKFPTYYCCLHFACSASDFDVSELESLFSAVVPKSGDVSSSDGRRKSLGSKSDKIHLVTISTVEKFISRLALNVVLYN